MPNTEHAAVLARLQVHWALQIPTAIASALVPEEPDDSHSNFGWSHSDRAFLSHSLGVVPELATVQIGLRPNDLTVVLVDGVDTAQLSLVGRTLFDSLSAVREGIEPMIRGALPNTTLRNYDMPPHPVADGAEFEFPAASIEPVVHLFGSLTRIFGEVEQRLSRELDGSVWRLDTARVWPHHFDLGGLLSAARNKEENDDERSVGYGISPGDDTFPLPYLYLNPYPASESGPGIDTRLGAWSTEGFRGFVAHSDELARNSDDQLIDAITELLLALTR